LLPEIVYEYCKIWPVILDKISLSFKGNYFSWSLWFLQSETSKIWNFAYVYIFWDKFSTDIYVLAKIAFHFWSAVKKDACLRPVIEKENINSFVLNSRIFLSQTCHWLFL